MQGSDSMAGIRLRVGKVELAALSDGQGEMAPTEALADSGMDIWRPE